MLTPDLIRGALGNGSSAPTSDFDLNPETHGLLPEGRKLRSAAVLIPLIAGNAGLDVILTRRSAALKHHPGQIAFPGGKQDAGDPTVLDTALREAREEIGLDPALITPLGQMDPHETVTGFQVTPVAGLITAEFTAIPELGEVEEVFRVPLSHVLKPENFQVHGRIWRGHMRRYYAVPYGPYYIWGATARILRALAEQVRSP